MGSRPKMIVRIPLEARYYEALCTAFPHVDFPLCLTLEELRAHIMDAVSYIGGAPIPTELLLLARALRWIQAPFAGVNQFLTPEIIARGITITNFSGIHVPNLPEHILAMMFSFARQLPRLVHLQDQHIWDNDTRDLDARTAAISDVFELEGQTLGVVGLGDIGASLAQKAHALGLRVFATRRHPGDVPPYVNRLLPSGALPELLANADHVVLCVPLTEETRHIINTAALAQMKPTAYLYNIGRGELIDQEALIVALERGTIAGAGLDVATPEPLPADSPLWDMPNVLITGHTSGKSPKYWDRGIALVIENVARFLAGEPLRNVVDPSAGY